MKLRWHQRSRYTWWYGHQEFEIEEVITRKGKRFAIYARSDLYMEYVCQTKKLDGAKKAVEAAYRMKGAK